MVEKVKRYLLKNSYKPCFKAGFNFLLIFEVYCSIFKLEYTLKERYKYGKRKQEYYRRGRRLLF